MKKLFGGILMAVGILIAGGSGLCSLAVLFGPGMGGFDPSILGMVAIVGGIPFAVGVSIALGGWALIRSARQDETQP